MDKSKAVYAGSFDPITNGHISIIEQGLDIFDELIIIIAQNPSKKYMFTKEERAEMIKKCFIDQDVTIVILPDGETVVEKASEMNCKAMIRGLRSAKDYEYEVELAATNKYIRSDVKTVMLLTEPEQQFVSSSRLRTLASLNISRGTLYKFAPPHVVRSIKRKMSGKDE